MQIVIDIPEGLKKDFELEQWTALSCMEMKDALLNGTPLPNGHGRLIDADALLRKHPIDTYPFPSTTINNAPTIIPADTETWHGIHAQITAPKGTFEKIWNACKESEDDI